MGEWQGGRGGESLEGREGVMGGSRVMGEGIESWGGRGVMGWEDKSYDE